MQKSLSFINIILVLLVMGCAATTTITDHNKKWAPVYRIQAGINHGGIVENTDLTQISNTKVDAYTGATKPGINAGAHAVLPVGNNAVETGVDYMYNKQTFTYHDDENNFSGSRKVGTSQIMLPVTYNIGLFRKSRRDGLFQIRLGYVFQYNLISISDNGSKLPECSYNKFSNGFTLGVSSTPFKLNNGSDLGFFIDVYKGSQIYRDFYNQSSFEMPSSSYIKAGIIYQFGKSK